MSEGKENNVQCLQNKETTKDNCSENVIKSKNKGKFMSALREWEKKAGFETPILWESVAVMTLFHVFIIVSPAYHFYRGIYPKWQTLVFGLFTTVFAGFGTTAGIHRYFCHRAYKAKMPLQIILMLAYSTAGHNSIYDWVRDHRVHHKFSDTSADPHNANRGFFFCHIGWLMMKKHPDVIREGNKINMSDITDDPLIQFHNKYFSVLKLLFCFVIPTLIPVMMWNEVWTVAFYVQFIRYIMSLHFTWSVNSVAHMWGNKPYDRTIKPSDNWLVSVVGMGEGWHNYHHTFPWDYKAAELPYPHNWATNLLDMFASIGWAYDLKMASPTMIESVSKKQGDSTRQYHTNGCNGDAKSD